MLVRMCSYDFTGILTGVSMDEQADISFLGYSEKHLSDEVYAYSADGNIKQSTSSVYALTLTHNALRLVLQPLLVTTAILRHNRKRIELWRTLWFLENIIC